MEPDKFNKIENFEDARKARRDEIDRTAHEKGEMEMERKRVGDELGKYTIVYARGTRAFQTPYPRR